MDKGHSITKEHCANCRVGTDWFAARKKKKMSFREIGWFTDKFERLHCSASSAQFVQILFMNKINESSVEDCFTLRHLCVSFLRKQSQGHS